MPDENYSVSETEINMRLDKFLSGKLPGMSRSYIQKQIKDGSIIVNGSKAKTGYKTGINDIIQVHTEPPGEPL